MPSCVVITPADYQVIGIPDGGLQSGRELDQFKSIIVEHTISVDIRAR